MDSTSTARTPYQLPLELVIYIVELLYFGEDGIPDRQTLRACSLVCTLWQAPIQKLLLRSFRLHAAKHPLLFLKDVFSDSSRGRQLGSYVRGINIYTTNYGYSDERVSFYTPYECAEILSLFPRLYELTLIVTGSDSECVVDHFHRAAKSESFPRRIRSLNLRELNPNSALLYRLLSLWPTIQFLSISPGIFSQFLPPPLERPTFELVQLELSIEVPRLDVLQWLVSNHSLRFLELRHIIIPADPVRAFLTREGKYLRSLRLIYSDLGDPIASLLDLLCPNLEELILETKWGHCEIKIEHLPQRLEHIQMLGSQFPSHFTFLCDVVRTLPRLRVLTLPWPSNRIGSGRFACKELEKECAARGVELVYSTQAHLSDDPVMVERFPRGRSVSHFRLMN